MYSWSANTLLINCHEFLTTRSHFALIYMIITQLPPLQVNYSSPHSKLIYIEKNSATISAVNVWNKLQTAFGDVILKNLTTIHIKILLNKKCIDKC